MNNTQIKADLSLVFITICWGVSYLLVDWALEEIGAMTLNTMRFLGAFILLLIILRKKIILSKNTLKYGCIIGFSLYIVYIGCTYSVLYTTLSNAGFLTAMCVVFTPLLGFIFLKQKITKKFFLVLVLSVVGVGFMSLTKKFSIASGDLLALLAAMGYSVDLILTEIAVKKEDVNPMSLGIIVIGICGTLNLISAFLLEEPNLPTTTRGWLCTLFLCVFCTALPFVIQPIAQQFTSASHVGVIFTLEPVFDGITAFVIVHEVLRPISYVGAVMMVFSLIIMEVDFKNIYIKIKKLKTYIN